MHKSLRTDRHTCHRRVRQAFSLGITLLTITEYFYSNQFDMLTPIGFLPSNKLTEEDWLLVLVLAKAAVDFAPALVAAYRDTLFEHLYIDYIYLLNQVVPLAPTPVLAMRNEKLMLSSTLM